MTTSDTPQATSAPEAAPATGRAMLMLALATIGFAVNFWAWALISPLGPMFRDTGSLGELGESDVALPVSYTHLTLPTKRIV